MLRVNLLLGMLLLVTEVPSLAADARPRPERSQPPHVVLIAVDTLRSDHLSCYGYARQTTPHIDNLASQGVLFEQCHSVASWTLSAFMSIMTGHLPASHGCRGIDSALSPTIPTLPQRLKERGYFCAAVVSNPYLNAKFGFGRGFDVYDDYTVFLDAELALLAADGPRESKAVTELSTGATVTRQARRLLSAAKRSGRPTFLFVHYFDPHDDYIPPAPLNRQFDPDYSGSITGRQLPALRNSPPPARDLQHLQALYDGEIAFDDAQVGQLLAAIDATFDPANTLVILLSDHGEAFGEHGMLLHSNSAYREEMQVPMIWRWTGALPAGQRVATPVAITDIAPTLAEILHLADINTPHARSLWPGLLGQPLPEADILGDKCLGPGHHIALTRGSLRLHARFQESPDEVNAQYEFYDLSSDPWEQRNLAASNPPAIGDMKASLLRIWSECQTLRQRYSVDTPANRVLLSEKERQRIKGLGYTDTPAGK